MTGRVVAVDSHVLLALLTDRSGARHRRARQLFSSAPAITAPMTVMLELGQRLESIGYARSDIVRGLLLLLGLANFRLDRDEAMRVALSHYRGGMRFTDAMHVAQCGHVNPLLTLDDTLIQKAESLRIWTQVMPVPPGDDTD